MSDLVARRRAFRKLHAQGCFVMPNPWDIGSARQLAGLGFKALATSSGAFAWTRGRPDSGVSRDEMLGHIREVVEATDLPVNADYLNAYADDPEEVAQNVGYCIETGVAGLSVEDMRDDRSLYDAGLALERVQAARAAIDESGADVLLTARCEAFLTKHTDPLAECCRRLEAFAAAGADVLYAPGMLDSVAMRTIVQAVGPKPVNVMVLPAHGSVAEVAALGVRRISLATALARAAWGGFLRAARELAEQGTFAALADGEPGADLNKFFRD